MENDALVRAGDLDDVVIARIDVATVAATARPELTVRGARGAHDESSFLLVRIALTNGVEGLGEVSATLRWSGEDATTAEHVIATALAPSLIGQRLAPVVDLDRRLADAVSGNTFTRAGVSTALWDAYAKTLGIPLAVALGGPMEATVPVKWSLSGDGDDLQQNYHAARRAGCTRFKVKIGMGIEDDLARIDAAMSLDRKAILGVDANGGYNRQEASVMVEELRRRGLGFFEQPVHPDDLGGAERLRGGGVSIVADESVFEMDSLVRVIEHRAADAVSLYVGKSGGPAHAVAMARLARAHGIGVVLGSNGELGVGAAAQAHVAAALPRDATWFPADVLGGDYYTEDVVVAGGPGQVTDGHLTVTAEPGLGVELKDSVLEMFRTVARKDGDLA